MVATVGRVMCRYIEYSTLQKRRYLPEASSTTGMLVHTIALHAFSDNRQDSVFAVCLQNSRLAPLQHTIPCTSLKLTYLGKGKWRQE